MPSSPHILGIDIGSVCITMIQMDRQKKIIRSAVSSHNGNVPETLRQLFLKFNAARISYIATTDSAVSFIRQMQSYDSQVAIIRAARYFHKDFGYILNIGGEKFSLSTFDENFNYLGSKFNTSCAAGTGSFLDQQALRLNLDSSEKISMAALSNKNEIPDIATRCAVFAKTDLIHAQQEGYSIEQICDGLCRGLAKNIVNTLFKNIIIDKKVIFCGGVSQNISVKRHLESILKIELITDSYSRFYKAAGAALCLIDDLSKKHLNPAIPIDFDTFDDLFVSSTTQHKHFYPELSLKLSDYPDFNTYRSYIEHDVEVDIYCHPGEIGLSECYLGIDVGSTSTKSVIINNEQTVLAGFYTRTASKPVIAVQKICRAIDTFIQTFALDLRITGCGTTGSGRKISAKIIGADISPDEITAHARAAYHLNPEVDTIIEIGGQDAKFTILKNGMVTSSVMNTVCAAGTGSFIEEQAMKLDCPLSQYSDRTEGVTSPVSSDRCTVFMERDINHFLSEGYTVDQSLASVLHSVRDNYLTKVANIGKIGHHILFQGATAKNKALIAAFEQKLNKSIQVSKYCHLTGALGVALILSDHPLQTTKFRGFDLWEKDIPVRKETCQLCNNNCKITIADIDGQTEAFGFLCGRDYETNHFVGKSNQFDLIKERLNRRPPKISNQIKHDITIGIPAGLHLFDDLEFWENFFSQLGIKTITSRHLKHPIELGKKVSGAEFCAPVTAFHGHIMSLIQKADYIFLPFYFEDRQKEKELRRQHCYYTQFAPSLISCIPGFDNSKIISPLVKYLYTNFHTKVALYTALKKIKLTPAPSFYDIHKAYDTAVEIKETYQKNLNTLFSETRKDKINVLLVGRPYTILSGSMNSGIPGIFANLDINTYFQDMLNYDNYDFDPIAPLLTQIHWKYAALILKATYIAAMTPDLYPVYVTSFKCSPDSFCVDYFKQIMEKFNKPYLVLELDEHDSSVGYETRVEAAVQAFRNHSCQPMDSAGVNHFQIQSDYCRTLDSKTIIFPRWDRYTGQMLVAILENEGHKAILMEETQKTIKQSLLTNTGQCIPLNAIASGFIHTVRQNNLDPSRTALWLNKSSIACNIKMYPHHIKRILEKEGNGFEDAGIYLGELSFLDISINAARNTYFAYMFGGLIKSVSCKIRPYEKHKGQTDLVTEEVLSIISKMFRYGTDKEETLNHAMSLFSKIETRFTPKPKIGIFGDLYIRDNTIINQDLIHFIESHGGEVVTTPYYKYVKIIASSYFKKWFTEGKYFDLISNKLIFSAMQTLEKKYYKYFEPYLGKVSMDQIDSPEQILKHYGILPEHTGESMDNILKIHHIMNEYPDIELLVQTNPSFCCPALITEAMASKIEEKTGVPIVNITYDISGGNKNKIIIPYLSSLIEKHHPQSWKASISVSPGR